MLALGRQSLAVEQSLHVSNSLPTQLESTGKPALRQPGQDTFASTLWVAAILTSQWPALRTLRFQPHKLHVEGTSHPWRTRPAQRSGANVTATVPLLGACDPLHFQPKKIRKRSSSRSSEAATTRTNHRPNTRQASSRSFRQSWPWDTGHVHNVDISTGAAGLERHQQKLILHERRGETQMCKSQLWPGPRISSIMHSSPANRVFGLGVRLCAIAHTL